MEYSKFLIIRLNYYFLQLILIILSTVWTLKNYQNLHNKNLTKYKRKFLEEINIEITIYILVFFELIYKIYKLSNFEKKNFIYLSSVILDFLTLLIFGLLFYFFEKNPFNLENLFLEEITLFGRALVLVFRVVCLTIEIINLRKICQNCKNIEISGIGDELGFQYRVMDRSSEYFYKNQKVECYEEIENLV